MERSRGTVQAGFTLIEILVSALVLVVIAAVAVVALLNALDKSRQRGTMQDMRAIAAALEAYKVDHGFLPGDRGGLQALVGILKTGEGVPLPTADHWNHPYRYSRDVTDDYSIESFGKDGVEGPNISLASRLDFDLDIVLSNGQFVASPE